MNDNFGVFVVITTIFGIGFLFGLIFGDINATERWENRLVEEGYAEYYVENAEMKFRMLK